MARKVTKPPAQSDRLAEPPAPRGPSRDETLSLDNGSTVTLADNGSAPLKGHEPHPSIVEANRDAMLDDGGPADTEILAAPQLVGFLAVSLTAGSDGKPWGKFFPVPPGFSAEEPFKDLSKRLAGEGDWKGHAIVVEANGRVSAQSFAFPEAPRG